MNIMVQEFIKEAGGSDIRCLVIGDRVIAAMKRQGAKGDFRSNLHRGGSAEVIKITPEERSTATRAASIMGLNVCGVDLLRSKHGPVVMEINSSPGWKGSKQRPKLTSPKRSSNLWRRMRNPIKQRLVAMAKKPRQAFEIGGTTIQPGTRQTVNLHMSLLSDHTPMDMPIHVIHGKRDGPRLFISAAIHGDELNGVEIIRRILKTPRVNKLRGTLIAVPIVNVFGFLAHTRYLPDRRDLNRSFPGNEKGSLTSQLAYLFMKEVVLRCTYGIDLHTGAIHRSNLPQIRADLTDPMMEQLAKHFSAPLVLHSDLRDGSLRRAATDKQIPTMLFEAGEALRFDELAIRLGVRGIIRVMQTLGMFGKPPRPSKKHQCGLPVILLAPGTNRGNFSVVVAPRSQSPKRREDGHGHRSHGHSRNARRSGRPWDPHRPDKFTGRQSRRCSIPHRQCSQCHQSRKGRGGISRRNSRRNEP